MTLEDLANLGELVGGLAVIVSLLYLAAQIRQGSRVASSAATAAILGSSVNMNMLTVGDISPVLTKSRRGETLDPEEEYRYFTFQMALLSQAWQVWHQHAAGLTDEGVFVAYERRMQDILPWPLARAVWQENRFRFAEDFQEWIDEIVEKTEVRPLDS